MKMNVLKTARMISKGRSIIGYSQCLNCFNICLILTKIAKLHFLQILKEISKKMPKMIFALPPSKK